jgi:hypothetical protein
MRLLRGVADELSERGVADREEGSGQELPFGAELVAVGLGDLLDDTVSTEQTELTGDLCGEPAHVRGRRGRRGRMEEAAQVTIAEASGGELAAGHGLQEREVGGVADAECTDTPVVVGGRLRDLIEQMVEGRAVVDDGEGAMPRDRGDRAGEGERL